MPSLISSFSAFFIVVFLDSLGSGFILRAFCLSFKVQWIENVFQDSLLANWLLVLGSYWFVYALIFFFYIPKVWWRCLSDVGGFYGVCGKIISSTNRPNWTSFFFLFLFFKMFSCLISLRSISSFFVAFKGCWILQRPFLYAVKCFGDFVSCNIYICVYDLWMLNRFLHFSIVKSNWLSCMIFLTSCWIWFASISLRILHQENYWFYFSVELIHYSYFFEKITSVFQRFE